MLAALDSFKQLRKWVAWKYRQRGKSSKPTKPPINPHNGRVASVADPATWGTYAEVEIFINNNAGMGGRGLMLTVDDNISGGDCDHCRNAETGEIDKWAAEIVAYHETYCEVSPSGTGLRFFWLGKLDHAVKNDKQQVEIYCEGRYLTVTGNKIEGCPDEVREAPRTLAALLRRAAIAEEGEEETSKANGKNSDDGARVEDEFGALNTVALKRLDDWVPHLFEGKQKPGTRGGYRIPSKSLGRDLEEDISITPVGIVDFGVADQGDEKKGKRTPIGLVMEHKRISFDEAVGYLSKQLGVQRPGLVLNPGAPIKIARALMYGRYLTEDGLPILHRHKGGFWIWRNNKYNVIEDETLRNSVWRFLENVRKMTQKGAAAFNPKRSHVSDVLDALNAVCAVDPFVAMPAWLKERDMPPAMEFLACANGLLHVPTQTMYPPTPDFFSVAATPAIFDPDAKVPELWLKFLGETLQDEVSIITLQDMFGYLLMADTSQQKIFFLNGPPRSGKGTVARVLREIIGLESYAGPSMAMLAENFGLEDLIDKTVAVIADARLDGRSNKAIIVERLLSISGEDTISVPRKFNKNWNGKLLTRLVVLSNELPALNEGSGALARRFIMLLFLESFLGREDTALLGKLILELSGILNWSLVGYMRLRERGYFIQPSNAEQQLEQIELLGAPIKAFIRDRCVVGPEYEVAVDDFYDRWKAWCAGESRRDPGSKEWLGRNLHSAIPGLRVMRRGAEGLGGRFYVGIGLSGAGDFEAARGSDPPF